MSKYPLWILERAFGGTHVADTPGSSASMGTWPIGKSAPGARHCCDLLINLCNNHSPPKKSVMVFLVGGAGNGKSFLAQSVTESVQGKRLSEYGKFASRNYDYQLENGKFFRVINDATIPPRDEAGSGDFLIKDISETLDNHGLLLACVNRGILVSEVNRRDAKQSDSNYRLSCNLVEWLLDGKKSDEVEEEGSKSFGIAPSGGSNYQGGGYYEKATLNRGSWEVADIHVVFMDQVSLLEPFPSISMERGDNGEPFLSAAKATLLPLSRRLGNWDDATEIGVLPLRDVFAHYFKKAREDGDKNGWPGGRLDPVRANLQSLCNDDSLDAFCSILRASEILAGGRISYRDAWGVAVLATTGAMPFSGRLEDHAVEVANMAARLEDPARYPLQDRLEAAVWLASRRYPVSLFSGGVPRPLIGRRHQPDYPVVQTLDFLAMADPVKSLPIGVHDVVKPKLMLLDEEAGPGAALADEDARFARVWGAIEMELEATLLKWLSQDDGGPSFRARREVLSWYGQYLYRCYAVAHGLPAHFDLLDVWQKTWNKVSNGHAPGDVVSLGLRNLIFTPYGSNSSEAVFPVFAPRVVPVSDSDEGSRVGVGVQSGHYNWSYRCSGDSILAQLRIAGDVVRGAELVIDFPMLREISAKSQGQGFTEAANDVEPRVERLRAEILSRATRGGGGAKPPIHFIDRGERLQ